MPKAFRTSINAPSASISGTASLTTVNVSGNISASAGTHTFGPTTFYDANGINFTGSSSIEGGQINLLGGSSYTNKAMQLDNYAGDLRILYNNGANVAATIAQATGAVSISTVLNVASTTNIQNASMFFQDASGNNIGRFRIGSSDKFIISANNTGSAGSAIVNISFAGQATQSIDLFEVYATKSTFSGTFTASTVDSTAGWTNITASTGYSSTAASGTYGVAQFRVLGNKVELRGTASGTVTSGNTFGTISASPTKSVRMMGAVNITPFSALITVNSSGVLQINTSATSPTLIHLDGLSFYINN